MRISPELGPYRKRLTAFKTPLCIFLILQLTITTLPSIAQDQTSVEQRLDQLTNKIVQKEIDLERYYLNYWTIGSREPKFRTIRYFMLQIGSAASSLGSNIAFLKLANDSLKADGAGDATGFETDDRAAALDEGTQSTNRTYRRALAASLVGTLLDAGSSVIELSSNAYTAFKNARQGNSPKAAVNAVIARVGEIDNLMLERKALLDSNPTLAASGLHNAETKVLRSFRDWCLSEFADLYSDIKSNQFSSNVYYLLDIASNGLYVASTALAYRAISPGRERLGGPSINTAIVGDSIGIIAPPASTLAYNKRYKHSRDHLEKLLATKLEKTEDEAKVALQSLNSQLTRTEAVPPQLVIGARNRAAMYAMWSNRFDDYLDKGAADLRYQNKVALQGLMTGPMISSTYLAQDVLTNIAFYRKGISEKTEARMAVGGAIASTAGTATSLGLTTYLFMDDIRHKRKLRKQGRTPEQLLQERFKTLDQLDRMLK